MAQQCVQNQSQGYWLFFYAFLTTISHIYKFQASCLILDFNETQDFDGKLQKKF